MQFILRVNSQGLNRPGVNDIKRIGWIFQWIGRFTDPKSSHMHEDNNSLSYLQIRIKSCETVKISYFTGIKTTFRWPLLQVKRVEERKKSPHSTNFIPKKIIFSYFAKSRISSCVLILKYNIMQPALIILKCRTEFLSWYMG